METDKNQHKLFAVASFSMTTDQLGAAGRDLVTSWKSRLATNLCKTES